MYSCFQWYIHILILSDFIAEQGFLRGGKIVYFEKIYIHFSKIVKNWIIVNMYYLVANEP